MVEKHTVNPAQEGGVSKAGGSEYFLKLFLVCLNHFAMLFKTKRIPLTAYTCDSMNHFKSKTDQECAIIFIANKL